MLSKELGRLLAARSTPTPFLSILPYETLHFGQNATYKCVINEQRLMVPICLSAIPIRCALVKT
ncbi:hypothetical protein Hanom_Chr16g01450361 [Helianthus anomalus]